MIKKISKKKAKQNRERTQAYASMDWEQVCQGCGRAGPVDHSHLLSQKDFPELAGVKANIVPHCRACHQLWENPCHRWKLMDFRDNMEFIQRIRPDAARQMIGKMELQMEKHYEGDYPEFEEAIAGLQ